MSDDKATDTPPEQNAGSPESSRVRSAERRGGGPAWLALLVGLAALAAVGWLIWERDQDGTDDALAGLQVGLGMELEQAAAERGALADRLSELGADLEALGTEVTALAQRPDAAEQVRGPLDALAGELNQLERELEGRMARIEDRFEDTLAELEAAGGRLGQADRELARQLALIEAQALLALGQDRLELAGDVETARLAWSRADRRLARLDDPRLGPVRRELGRELEALEAFEPVDWAGRVARLQALAEAAGDWPVRSDPARRPAAEDAPDGWRQRLRRVLARLVTVREREAAGPGPVEIETARERMRLLLTTAGLAAARRDEELLAQLISAALAEMDRVFDPAAGSVVRARNSLAELAEAPPEPTLPRVGEARLELARLMGEPR